MFTNILGMSSIINAKIIIYDNWFWAPKFYSIRDVSTLLFASSNSNRNDNIRLILFARLFLTMHLFIVINLKCSYCTLMNNISSIVFLIRILDYHSFVRYLENQSTYEIYSNVFYQTSLTICYYFVVNLWYRFEMFANAVA